MTRTTMAVRFVSSVLLAPASLVAQAGSGPVCVATIPDSALVRAPVFLRAELPDSLARVFRQPLYFLAQSVATQLRRQLGGRTDSVPHGDPAITWMNVTGRMPLVARRDRSWARVGWGGTPASGTALLLLAIDSVRSAGDPFDWPDHAHGDSLSFALTLVLDAPNGAGKIAPLKTATDAFPVFTVPSPSMEDSRVVHQVPPHYPQQALWNSVIGNVILSFYLDENGQVEKGSIVAESPPGRPMRGLEASVYDQFVEGAKESVATGTYTPKRIGGCGVRTQVKQPFAFCISTAGCYGDKRP